VGAGPGDCPADLFLDESRTVFGLCLALRRRIGRLPWLGLGGNDACLHAARSEKSSGVRHPPRSVTLSQPTGDESMTDIDAALNETEQELKRFLEEDFVPTDNVGRNWREERRIIQMPKSCIPIIGSHRIKFGCSPGTPASDSAMMMKM